MKNKLLIGAMSFALLGAGVTARADGDKTFNNKDLHGTYVENFNGFASSTAATSPTSGTGSFSTGSAFPESGTGTLNADGNGNFHASLTFNTGGLTCSGTVAGTYTVNADGTGTSRGVFTPNAAPSNPPPQIVYSCPPGGGNQDEAFTIVGANKVEFISTDSDTTISGTARRQNHGGGDD